MVEVGADIGLAFDGDADRVFLVDEQGVGLSGSTTTAIIAAGILDKHPGETVIHNLICSRTVPEVVREHGGTPVRTRVGHSFIKQVMAETGAIFGGEHSAHYYFRDNFRADSGLIAALVVLEQLSVAGVPLSELRAPFERYADSGEINTRVSDTAEVIERVAAHFADAAPGPDGRADRGRRRLVVQPAPVQHRAAAAPQPGGAGPGAAATSGSPRSRPSWPTDRPLTTRGTPPSMTTDDRLDPQLLELLACPEDKGPLLYFADEQALYNPRLQAALRRHRRDPRHAHRARRCPWTTTRTDRLVAKAEAEGIEPTFKV